MREREVWRNNNKIIAIRRVKERLRKIVLVLERYIGRECGRGIKRKRERERQWNNEIATGGIKKIERNKSSQT